MYSSLGTGRVQTLIRAQQKAQGLKLLAAAICAIVVSVGAVVLLGLSGWFLTASALAGMGGVLVAKAFNYMIPSAMIRLLAILRTAGRYGERVTGHDAALYALAAMRPQLFNALSRAPVEHSLSLTSGEASARLMQDVDAIQNRFVRLSAPWGAATAVLCGLIMCAFAGWTTALAVTVITVAGMVTAALIGRLVSIKAGYAVQNSAGELKDLMSSLVAATPELRAYAMTDKAADTISVKADTYDIAQRKLAFSGSLIMTSQMLFMAMAVTAAYLTTVSGNPALTALAILGAVASIDAAGTLMTAIRQNGTVMAASQRLNELMGLEVARTDDTPLPSHVKIGNLPTMCTRQRLAIIGASGSGKTTLIERMLHLRTPQRGEISLGSVDVADLSPSQARSLFAYAPQQAQFISGTVADNLRLGSPSATSEQMWQALEDACIAERFLGTSAGLDTPLGENALNLSGGERRRLGLARAYLRSAPFLVLDEPTEGLDATTEERVIARLDARLKTNMQGLILISHRPAPLTLSSTMAVVEGIGANGKVMLSTILPHGPKAPVLRD